MSKVLVLGALPDSLLIFRGALIERLRAAGYEVTTAAAPASASVLVRLAEKEIPFFPIDMQRTGLNPFADLKTFLACYRLMREVRPDIVLCYTAKPVIYGLLAARLAGVRYLAAMIEGLGFAFTGTSLRHRILGRILRGLYRLSLTGCSTVFFLNPDDEGYFVRGRMLSKASRLIRLNGIGVDLQKFFPVPLPSAPSFLLVARLLRDKGVMEYAEAARKIKARYPSVRFLLVGWLDSNPSCIEQSLLDSWVQEGTIEYLGRLDDVRPAYSMCSVYVLPSYREGLPVTVMEAMAMGRPIIVTDVPGCRETVQDGVNGKLVPAKNVDALADAMLEFVENPEMALGMGKESRRIAEERYDVHKINEQIMNSLGL